MPPKRNFDRIFLPFTLAVEKKINRLATYMESLEDDNNIGEFKIRILMTHADTLRGNLDRMETEWDSQRDGIAQQDYIRIKTFVEESMAAAEAALVKADSFVCHAAQQSTSKVRGTKSEDVHS